MTGVYLIAAKRTPIGSFGGSLRDAEPAHLGAQVARAALDAARVAPQSVGHVVFGQVIATSPRDLYLARVIALEAGMAVETPAITVNRLCGSGLQAILYAAQALMLGDADVAVAGGAEVMSRAPFLAPAARWGQRMGDALLVDALKGALTDPFHAIMMGDTAENVAARYAISRERQDALAVQSQRRAAHAITEGRFQGQLVPIEIGKRGRVSTFDTDEYPRGDATPEGLAELRTIFRREGGTVTAGNASGINDGAAAVVLATERALRDFHLTPLARLVTYGHAGVDPAFMGIGPVPATRMALDRAKLQVTDLDIVESNEAFASQACAVSDQLGFDPERTNPNGSGISLGHPVGATGAIVTVKLVHELNRTNGRYGLATMCIGGGQGIAAVFERV